MEDKDLPFKDLPNDSPCELSIEEIEELADRYYQMILDYWLSR